MNKVVGYADSNRLGKFNIAFEIQRDRALMAGIMGLCTVLEAFPHESGRGTNFIAASSLFQELAEGDEIPQYRIDIAVNEAFQDSEVEARRVDITIDGSVVGVAATRQIIVRVPPAQLHHKAALPGRRVH